jgi:hypothetical protein
MAEKICEFCANPFTPIMERQRFCCRVCLDAWFAEERREAVALLRQRNRETATEDAHE